jgi:leucyl aminopeptidase (aminopeptidase T)
MMTEQIDKWRTRANAAIRSLVELQERYDQTQAETEALRPLRAAALRYGRAVQQVRARGGSIVDAVGYDEWCEALEAVETLALALATDEAAVHLPAPSGTNRPIT